ncbi:hypothetical protein [Sphingobium sp. DC-2]|uniref:hypothetical protein n=1 Tax=Sphingobium sp. DC-2 TaxID=1303256 RepID=UPI0004C2F16E|nr:hypothetical protein [Sphingobium sp. DC-2]
MTTGHLERPMQPEAVAIGEKIEARISSLLDHAYQQIGDPRRFGPSAHNDALSMLFELAAAVTAQAIEQLGKRYPLATADQIWLTGITDLQMRASVRLADFRDRQNAKGNA